jgi:anaerobic selenocysteine-containing dehydrogenase
MEPGQVPDRLRTPSGKIECAPEAFVADLPRLRASLDRAWDESMVLIGRRHIRSNNSWMHNVDVLMKGRNRCTLLVHPDDADRLGLVDGGPARVTSEAGEVVVTAELSDTVRPGVVSLPHGFGQGGPGVRLAVASEYRGVNSNVLTPAGLRDEASGTAVLNGIPVTLVAG